MARGPTWRDKAMTPHIDLVKVCVEEITRLGSLKLEEIMKQNEIGFFELLDMSLTLAEYIKSRKGMG